MAGKRRDGCGLLSYVEEQDTKDGAAPVDAIVNAADQDVQPLEDGVRVYVQRSPDLRRAAGEAERDRQTLGHAGV